MGPGNRREVPAARPVTRQRSRTRTARQVPPDEALARMSGSALSPLHPGWRPHKNVARASTSMCLSPVAEDRGGNGSYISYCCFDGGSYSTP
ncbi:hypothetical protein EVAR_96168_1 [Eumeta japonica]|uniref:Uncharacterized protein n=1 Tax=Eumeta variegata TaxID=151549 RepID=A0A4C1VHZ9_EUMVA|nr:hypothetical protein EVAR_96168_1 [Eumeta japonica]